MIFAGKLAGETKPKIYINGKGFRDTYLQVRLIENDPNSRIAAINVWEEFDHTIILTEVNAGNVITLSNPLLEQKNALFIAANPNNNKFRLSSLELPLGRESAFDEKGRLIQKPTEVVGQPAKNMKIVERPVPKTKALYTQEQLEKIKRTQCG